MLPDVTVIVLICNRCVIIAYFYFVVFRNGLKVKGRQVKDVWGIHFYIDWFIFLRRPSLFLCSPLKKQFHQLHFGRSTIKL